MPLQLGLVGKPNTGKSTFFSAATLIDVKRAPYPFTTINPNIGVGYVRIKCICKELNLVDNPRNSICVDGWRFIPIELIDVAGLVPEAWKGKGLGNRFLDELRRANALIHIIDAAGTTDSEGKPVKPGTHDPLVDIEFLERELDMWIFQILKKDWAKLVKIVEIKKNVVEELYNRLSGLGIDKEAILYSLNEADLASKRISNWSDNDLMNFVRNVRTASKPLIIAANKADIDVAVDNIKYLMREVREKYIIVPTSAEAELALRRAANKGLIKYIPGDSSFEILKDLKTEQLRALEYIEEKVLRRWGNTGVQQVLNRIVFEKLGMIAVYPVENENKYTDHRGNVLPDVFLIPKDMTAKELAYLVHTEIGEKFAFAIDAMTKKRLPADSVLKHRMVIKFVVSK